MSKPPWTISSSKRKVNSGSAPAATRKRQRVGGEATPNPSRRKSQQTLTQAQWLAALPPSFEEADMQLLDEDRPRIEPAKQKPRQRVKKRDSTLTQMDFFNLLQDHHDIDDEMIEPGEAAPQQLMLPQFDGAYDIPQSPRKPRTRKAIPLPAGNATKRRNAAESQEEYKPGGRKRKSDTIEDESVGSGKRQSRRLATKSQLFSDPDYNYDYFAEALGTPASVVREDGEDQPFGFPLEVKDSTEENAAPQTEDRPTSPSSLFPQTPTRETAIVLSSQSPESLGISTRRATKRPYESPTKPQRTPLAERSTNVSLRATPQTAGKRNRVVRKSPKTKVVVLKLPKKSQPRRPTRVEDSQHLWSIPSSSPKPAKPSHHEVDASQAILAADDLEIPATSESQGNLESLGCSQDSLPSLSAFLSERSRRKSQTSVSLTDDQPCLTRIEEEGFIIRDFGAMIQSAPAHDSEKGAPTVPSSPPAAAMADSAPSQITDVDEDLDFGSPIMNDTQFNIEVQHRVSSPVPTGRSLLEQAVAVDLPSPSKPMPHASTSERAEIELPDIDRVQSSQSPIPVPKLVSRSSDDRPGHDVELDEVFDEPPLPEPVLVHPTSIHRTISTQVPLNDAPQSSSSPRPRLVRMNTQKSNHPASMPHPSQMSTQDPTQAYFPPSSMPQNDEVAEKSEKVTIKDSSSDVPLSQIPRHIRSSQAGPDPAAALDDYLGWDEEDDYDLDPLTLPPASEFALPCEEGVQAQIYADMANQTAPKGIGMAPRSSPEPVPVDATNKPHASQEEGLESQPWTPGGSSPLKEQHSPIPGFDNETQSNFTQNGHVSAAYIHRQREAGLYPAWFVPTPFQLPGYDTRRE